MVSLAGGSVQATESERCDDGNSVLLLEDSRGELDDGSRCVGLWREGTEGGWESKVGGALVRQGDGLSAITIMGLLGTRLRGGGIYL